jgi:hypothetical protein
MSDQPRQRSDSSAATGLDRRYRRSPLRVWRQSCTTMELQRVVTIATIGGVVKAMHPPVGWRRDKHEDDDCRPARSVRVRVRRSRRRQRGTGTGKTGTAGAAGVNGSTGTKGPRAGLTSSHRGRSFTSWRSRRRHCR